MQTFAIRFEHFLDLSPQASNAYIDHVTSQLLERLAQEHADYPGLVGNTVAICRIDHEGKDDFLLRVNVPDEKILEFIKHSSFADEIEQVKKDMETKYFRLVVMQWSKEKQSRLVIHAQDK